MERRTYLGYLVGATASLPVAAQEEPDVVTGNPGTLDTYNVVAFGAKQDGKQSDTAAIQRAIDVCAAGGGGIVYLPKGDYLCSTVVLKSHINLHLAAGARILGTGNVEDYSAHRCILYANSADRISVTGRGIVDGRGAGTTGQRYQLIHFESCTNVLLNGVELKDSSVWCVHLVECNGVQIRGVKIDSFVNPNNDGFDIDSCQNVVISDCHVICGDDAIALKTNSEQPCRNITVTNCIFQTRWAAFRFGPEARGNFENITVSNCVIHDSYGCGIKLQMNEGAEMKDIVFDNLVMDNVTGPITMRLANWVGGLLTRSGNEERPIGKFRNVLLNNIRARVIPKPLLGPGQGNAYPGEEKSCMYITGLPGHPIEGITMSNIHITYPGGGTAEEAARRDVPDLPDTYPEYFMFGTLPSYGLYVHHAKGLTLDNVRFELESPDLRPAIVCDDVSDLDISGLRADSNPSAESLIRLQSTRHALLRDSRPVTECSTFLRVEGADCGEIGVTGNDLRRAKKIMGAARGASEEAVWQLSNLGV